MNNVHRPAAVGITLAGLAAWLTGRATWVHVVAFDDKSGEVARTIAGSTWSGATTALSVLLCVAGVAVLVLRSLGRRVAGIIAAIAAVAASWPATNLFLYGADPQRARNLLVDGLTSSRATAPETITGWATIQSLSVGRAPVLIFLTLCAVALVLGIVVALRPGTNSVRDRRYETRDSRQDKLKEDLSADPDSGRVLWDALDADIDPTEDTPER